MHKALSSTRASSTRSRPWRLPKASASTSKAQGRHGVAETDKEIEETRALAEKLGIQGTPHFFVGDQVIPGAPEDLLDQLAIQDRRCPQVRLQRLLTHSLR